MKDDKSLFVDMIDKDIDIDLSILPLQIVNIIKELEELNKKEDWFFYDIKFDELEIVAKSAVIKRKISSSMYNKLLEKYGGLYD